MVYGTMAKIKRASKTHSQLSESAFGFESDPYSNKSISVEDVVIDPTTSRMLQTNSLPIALIPLFIEAIVPRKL